MGKSLFRSVSVVSLCTFFSRILGFVRDLVAAQLFGVSASVDAFYIAFKIPNFMRNLFAEGSFSQAFVPVLSDYRHNRKPEEVRTFVNHMAGALTLILLGVTVAGVLWAEGLVHLFSPGLDPYRFDLAVSMLRITFPYLMLISLTAFAGSVLNSYGQFGIPAFTPALLNLCLIATAVGMMHWFAVPVFSQAWGVLIAGFVQLLVQMIALQRTGLLPRPGINTQDKGVYQVLKLLVPALFGASMGQISILVNTILASFLVTGSITWLYYSERLAYFPLGVFGVALATVILPHLSRQHAAGSQEEFSAALDWGLRWNLIIGVPASLTMLVLSGPLIVSLFQYGKFTVHDVIMTQKSVIAYGIGLQAFMLVKILSSAFYARQDIKTPVRISMISLGMNIVFSILLVKPLAHAGLALSSSLGAWINAAMLLTVLLRRRLFIASPQWKRFMVCLVLANSLPAVFLWYVSADMARWLDWNGGQRLFSLAGLGVGAMVIYLGSLWIANIWPRKWPVMPD